MQDNELDKLINDAANQHHPPYNDADWGKMLVLLDKHMPQKKDRRKPILFLPLLLLIGIGVLLGIWQPWNKKSPSAIANNITVADNKKNNTQQQANDLGGSNETVKGDAVTPLNKTTVNTDDSSNTPNTTVNSSSVADAENIATKNKKPFLNNNGPVKVKIKRPGVAYSDYDNAITDTEKLKVSNKTNKKITASTALVGEEKTALKNNAPEGNETPAELVTKINVETEKQKESAPSKDTTPAKQQTLAAATSKTKNGKSNKSFANNFALTVSAGADISFVSLNNPGKIQPVYGAGTAYTFGKHLKISSGFYVSKKVYDAQPYQYKFSGASYPNLTNIKANCNIYEIALNIYYSFKQQKKHNWFAGGGISSLLMKKEVYNYQYKNQWGVQYSYAKTISNQNKHYFSVLTLSGGYQYKLSNRVSLTAEPYLKLPISGIGDGRIKVNSSGLLFTAAISPFVKKSKK